VSAPTVGATRSFSLSLHAGPISLVCVISSHRAPPWLRLQQAPCGPSSRPRFLGQRLCIARRLLLLLPACFDRLQLFFQSRYAPDRTGSLPICHDFTAPAAMGVKRSPSFSGSKENLMPSQIQMSLNEAPWTAQIRAFLRAVYAVEVTDGPRARERFCETAQKE
jgi:hypothetical protein